MSLVPRSTYKNFHARQLLTATAARDIRDVPFLLAREADDFGTLGRSMTYSLTGEASPDKRAVRAVASLRETLRGPDTRVPRRHRLPIRPFQRPRGNVIRPRSPRLSPLS